MTIQQQSERIALDLALRYEISQGRTPTYIGDDGVSAALSAEIRDWVDSDLIPSTISCDLVSRDPAGHLARLIEVKGRRSTSTSVSVFDRQLESANLLGARWWLYVAFNCGTDNPFLTVVDEPHKLPWYRLDDTDTRPARAQGRVKHEGTWHVMPANILAAGTRITFTPA